MKKRLAGLALLVFVAGLALATQAQTPPPGAAPTGQIIQFPSTPNAPVAPPQPQAPAVSHERHPEIRRAQHALSNAKNDLEHATHDYAGHRVKALEHIQEAQQELELALQSVGKK